MLNEQAKCFLVLFFYGESVALLVNIPKLFTYIKKYIKIQSNHFDNLKCFLDGTNLITAYLKCNYNEIQLLIFFILNM